MRPPDAGNPAANKNCRNKRKWTAPKASHLKASHPHFPHFRAVRVLFRVWLSDALSSKRITKLYSEPIQTVLTTSQNRTWKQPKPYSICTRTKARLLSFSVGLTRKILSELAHIRTQTIRETVLGQRLIHTFRHPHFPNFPRIRATDLLRPLSSV